MAKEVKEEQNKAEEEELPDLTEEEQHWNPQKKSLQSEEVAPAEVEADRKK